jgi:ABC-type uncharacterized transport system, permease component
MGVKYYFRLWIVFLSCNLQSKIAHKIDFILGILATLFMQGCSFIFLWSIFSQIDNLAGWKFHEICLLFSYISITNGLEEIFLNGTWELPGVYIRRGELDRLLTKPVNPLFLILANCMELHGIGSLLFGIVLMSYSLIQLGISLILINILFIIISIISSTIIFFSINLITSTLSFWVMDSMPAMIMVQRLNQLGQYPMNIYNKVIKFVLTWIIPFGFISYFPTDYILNSNIIGLLSPIFAIVFFLLAYSFFKLSLKKYESAGG